MPSARVAIRRLLVAFIFVTCVSATVLPSCLLRVVDSNLDPRTVEVGSLDDAREFLADNAEDVALECGVEGVTVEVAFSSDFEGVLSINPSLISISTIRITQTSNPVWTCPRGIPIQVDGNLIDSLYTLVSVELTDLNLYRASSDHGVDSIVRVGNFTMDNVVVVGWGVTVQAWGTISITDVQAHDFTSAFVVTPLASEFKWNVHSNLEVVDTFGAFTDLPLPVHSMRNVVLEGTIDPCGGSSLGDALVDIHRGNLHVEMLDVVNFELNSPCPVVSTSDSSYLYMRNLTLTDSTINLTDNCLVEGFGGGADIVGIMVEGSSLTCLTLISGRVKDIMVTSSVLDHGADSWCGLLSFSNPQAPYSAHNIEGPEDPFVPWELETLRALPHAGPTAQVVNLLLTPTVTAVTIVGHGPHLVGIPYDSLTFLWSTPIHIHGLRSFQEGAITVDLSMGAVILTGRIYLQRNTYHSSSGSVSWAGSNPSGTVGYQTSGGCAFPATGVISSAEKSLPLLSSLHLGPYCAATCGDPSGVLNANDGPCGTCETEDSGYSVVSHSGEDCAWYISEIYQNISPDVDGDGKPVFNFPSGVSRDAIVRAIRVALRETPRYSQGDADYGRVSFTVKFYDGIVLADEDHMAGYIRRVIPWWADVTLEFEGGVVFPGNADFAILTVEGKLVLKGGSFSGNSVRPFVVQGAGELVFQNVDFNFQFDGSDIEAVKGVVICNGGSVRVFGGSLSTDVGAPFVSYSSMWGFAVHTLEFKNVSSNGITATVGVTRRFVVEGGAVGGFDFKVEEDLSSTWATAFFLDINLCNPRSGGNTEVEATRVVVRGLAFVDDSEIWSEDCDLSYGLTISSSSPEIVDLQFSSLTVMESPLVVEVAPSHRVWSGSNLWAGAEGSSASLPLALDVSGAVVRELSFIGVVGGAFTLLSVTAAKVSNSRADTSEVGEVSGVSFVDTLVQDGVNAAFIYAHPSSPPKLLNWTFNCTTTWGVLPGPGVTGLKVVFATTNGEVDSSDFVLDSSFINGWLFDNSMLRQAVVVASNEVVPSSLVVSDLTFQNMASFSSSVVSASAATVTLSDVVVDAEDQACFMWTSNLGLLDLKTDLLVVSEGVVLTHFGACPLHTVSQPVSSSLFVLCPFTPDTAVKVFLDGDGTKVCPVVTSASAEVGLVGVCYSTSLDVLVSDNSRGITDLSWESAYDTSCSETCISALNDCGECVASNGTDTSWCEDCNGVPLGTWLDYGGDCGCVAANCSSDGGSLLVDSSQSGGSSSSSSTSRGTGETTMFSMLGFLGVAIPVVAFIVWRNRQSYKNHVKVIGSRGSDSKEEGEHHMYDMDELLSPRSFDSSCSTLPSSKRSPSTPRKSITGALPSTSQGNKKKTSGSSGRWVTPRDSLGYEKHTLNSLYLSQETAEIAPPPPSPSPPSLLDDLLLSDDASEEVVMRRPSVLPAMSPRAPTTAAFHAVVRETSKRKRTFRVVGLARSRSVAAFYRHGSLMSKNTPSANIGGGSGLRRKKKFTPSVLEEALALPSMGVSPLRVGGSLRKNGSSATSAPRSPSSMSIEHSCVGDGDENEWLSSDEGSVGTSSCGREITPRGPLRRTHSASSVLNYCSHGFWAPDVCRICQEDGSGSESPGEDMDEVIEAVLSLALGSSPSSASSRSSSHTVNRLQPQKQRKLPPVSKVLLHPAGGSALALKATMPPSRASVASLISGCTCQATPMRWKGASGHISRNDTGVTHAPDCKAFVVRCE